jgi:hypothetical protein
MSDSQLIINTIDSIHSLHGIKALRRAGVRNRYMGPCVRCKIEGRGSPLGGDDRLTVFIDRPAYGNGSMYDPVFTCRECPSDAQGHGFVGDLIAYIRAGSDMTFAQALEYIGIDPMTHGSNGKRLLSLSFKVQGLSPQNTRWIETGNKFIHKSMKNLFDPEFSDCLEFLKEDRGFTEDILHRAMVGWNEDERYENAEDWGMGKGRIKIHRGFVYPEYHLSDEGEMALYSIAIRRIQSDMDDEFELTGKTPSKTMVLADSQKSLYMASTIRRGKICFLIEGQSDALSILQSGQGRWSVGATQGVKGARTTLTDVLLWLSQADVVVIMLDGDEAGEGNSQYWHGLLPYSMVMSCPTGKDPNKMLVDGTLHEFCELAEEMAYEAFPGRQLKSRGEIAETVIVDAVVTSEPDMAQEAPIVVSVRNIAMRDGIELDTHDWNTMPPLEDTHPELPYAAPSMTLGDDEILINGEIYKKRLPPIVAPVVPTFEAPLVVEMKVASAVTGIKVEGKSSKGNKKSRTDVKLTGEMVNVAGYWSQIIDTPAALIPPALLPVEKEVNNAEEIAALMDRAFAFGCSRCGGEVGHIDVIGENRVVGRCESYPNCEAHVDHRCARCPARMAVADEFGYQWCLLHRDSQRFLDYGMKMNYCGFYVNPVMAYNNPFTNEGEKVVAPFMVRGGMSQYEKFALTAPVHEVWAAGIELYHSVTFEVPLTYNAPPAKPVNMHPCARVEAGCTRDYTKRHGAGSEEHWDNTVRRMVPTKKELYGGRDVEVDGEVYHFCYHCTSVAWFLDFGKALGFPAMYRVLEGQPAWMEMALCSKDEFYFTMTFDTMRRQYKDIWEKLAEAM